MDSVDTSQLCLSLSQDTGQTVGLQVASQKIVGEDTVVTLTFLPSGDLTRQRELEEVLPGTSQPVLNNGNQVYLPTDYVLSDSRNWSLVVPAGAVTQYSAHQIGGTQQSVSMATNKLDQFWTFLAITGGRGTWTPRTGPYSPARRVRAPPVNTLRPRITGATGRHWTQARSRTMGRY